MNKKITSATYKSQLPTAIRALYAIAFLLGGILLVLENTIYADVFGILLILCAILSLFYSTFVKVEDNLLTAGIIGIPLVKWELSEISTVVHYSHNELPVAYNWLFGFYIRDVNAIFFASGREVISLSNSKKNRRLMVSIKNSAELASLLRKTESLPQ